MILTLDDDTEIYYKDWGKGQPVVFSHGWPLTADAWEDQMVFLANHGYRCIAHDRRGHGRSSQPWNGNDMDTYADDLAALVEALDLSDAIHVGHSTGGGEVARYIGRHGTKRVAKAVLIGAVPPLMLKTEANPGGLPIAVFDDLRAKVLADRSQFFQDLSEPFYGANRPGAKVSQGLRDLFWLQGMQAGFPGRHRLYQGILGDGLHRRSQEVRCTDSDHPWRRRPDRADRRVGPAIVQDGKRGRTENPSRRAPRPVLDSEGRNQRRPAGLFPGRIAVYFSVASTALLTLATICICGSTTSAIS